MRSTSRAFTLTELPVVSRKPKGFTIVELLVVITIIIVLLALLTPALDQAIYQAKLAQCGARLGGHVQGAATYAFDHNRWYPRRTAFTGSHPWINTLRGRTQTGSWNDDRPTLFPYIQSRLFLDPLCSDEIDLEDESIETFQSTVTATYTPYYGVKYTAEKGSKGLRKVGNKLQWRGNEFNCMVGDQDWASGRITTGSHPDFNPQTMVVQEWQNDPLLAGPEGMVISAAAGYNFVMARWTFTSGPGVPGWRGVIDANFGMQDGSVVRYNALPRDARNENYDGNIERLCTWFNAGQAQTENLDGIWFQAPMR